MEFTCAFPSMILLPSKSVFSSDYLKTKNKSISKPFSCLKIVQRKDDQRCNEHATVQISDFLKQLFSYILQVVKQRTRWGETIFQFTHPFILNSLYTLSKRKQSGHKNNCCKHLCPSVCSKYLLFIFIYFILFIHSFKYLYLCFQAKSLPKPLCKIAIVAESSNKPQSDLNVLMLLKLFLAYKWIDLSDTFASQPYKKGFPLAMIM